VLLSLRAHALIRTSTRGRLAHRLCNLPRVAHRTLHPLDPALRHLRSEVRGASDLFYDLADILEACQLADPRGVARIALIMRDGTSPLYEPRRPGEPRIALQAVIEILTEPPTIQPVA
jgi:hypothetical protein